MKRINKLETYLKNIFGWTSFKMGQREIISDILAGEDVLGVLPTGSGKSLCYQLPAQILPGLTIVVSPLISLMEDQEKQLKARGIKNVVAINSFLSYQDRQHIYNHLNQYKLIFVSPEILQQDALLNRLKVLTISLFVIDEAHCISQWGHEFRPDYLRLAKIIEQLNHPPILALSATVTKQIEQDILLSLNRPKMNKHIYPINRENIVLNVKRVHNDEEKNTFIRKLLSNRRVPTLIYFSSRKATESITKYLQNHLPHHRIAYYHGGMEATERISIQQQFMNDQLDVVCCTSAFGMGIDKSDIRLVIHYHISSQMESFIQEFGRAGRDGKESISLVLHHDGDQVIPKRLIASELPTDEQIDTILQKLYEIYQTKGQMPLTDDAIINTFNCTLTQWGFLFYQLEKSGIIKENKVIYHKSTWHNFLKNIKHVRDQRLKFKQDQLQTMVEWLNSSLCLREPLYKKFQTTTVRRPSNCCQYCGFDLDRWQPAEKESPQKTNKSWDERLKSILQIEDSYEPEKIN